MSSSAGPVGIGLASGVNAFATPANMAYLERDWASGDLNPPPMAPMNASRPSGLNSALTPPVSEERPLFGGEGSGLTGGACCGVMMAGRGVSSGLITSTPSVSLVEENGLMSSSSLNPNCLAKVSGGAVVTALLAAVS